MNMRIHPEGHKYIAIFAGVAVVLFMMSDFLGWLGLLLTAWCIFFFRDPDRHTPVREGLVVSPADGVVQMITRAVPPAELDAGSDALTRISVFMNVFDCHVNRMPVSGAISRLAYRPGRFLNAAMDKASDENERSSISIDMGDGKEIHVVQIAGLVARRIVSFVEEGDDLSRGERFGMIRFGSRVDVYLPDGVEPLVGVGQRAIAGETVFADNNSDEARRETEVR